MVDPIDYTRGNGFGQGLQLAGLYQDVQQRRAQAEQAQAQQEALNAFQADWKESFGDPQKMAALVAKYPGQMDAIKAGIGFQDEQHQMALGNAARDLRVAMATGNPQAVQQAALNHANVLGSVGSSPEEIVQQFQQDPNSLAHIVDAVGLNALGAKDYYGVTGDREKLAETIRSNQASEANTIRGQNIAASNAAASRAQQAQFHSDNVALKLQELSAKQQEQGKIDPKLVRDLNSDLNGFSKNYSAMRGAADNLQALGKRNTPAAQLGMIFNYMKSLDPQSVVREGEQVQVKRTDGIFGTMSNYVSQLSNGKMLNDGQVNDLINTSKLMANTEGKKFNQQMDDYLSSYGGSLPTGLEKSLQSRKAKLYTDIPEAAPVQQKQVVGSGYSNLWGD